MYCDDKAFSSAWLFVDDLMFHLINWISYSNTYLVYPAADGVIMFSLFILFSFVQAGTSKRKTNNAAALKNQIHHSDNQFILFKSHKYLLGPEFSLLFCLFPLKTIDFLRILICWKTWGRKWENYHQCLTFSDKTIDSYNQWLINENTC